MFVCITVALLTCLMGPREGHCGPLRDGDMERDVGTSGRWRREHCALLTAPWRENRRHAADTGTHYRISVFSLPDGGPGRAVFPDQALFRFVRRVYRCCQMGFHCQGIKGIQGQLSGDTDVEFFLSPDVLTATVVKAELHLRLSNPLLLKVEPWLPSLGKHKQGTRYSSWFGDGALELRVDLLFMFQRLQESVGSRGRGATLVDLRRVGGLARQHGGSGLRAGQETLSLQDTDGDMWGEGRDPLLSALELDLMLQCSREESRVYCEDNGVHLLHAPFVAISYK